MTGLGLLAAYSTLFAAGLGMALLLMRAPAINLIELAALSWLLGIGIVSLLLWFGGIFVSGLALQLFVTLVGVLLGFAGWRLKKTKTIRFSLPRPSNRLEWILASLLVVELIAIFFVSLKHTLGWDGLFNWELKARYAFLNSGVLSQSYYSTAGRAFSHPEYPLAIPFTELWLYLWMGEPHQFWVKTVFPLFYIAGALLVALLLTRLTGKRWLGLLIAFLIPLVPFVIGSPGGVIVGYVDIPLGVYYVAALGYLLCSLDRKWSRSFMIYGATLTLIPWIKTEGAVLWLVLALIGLTVGLYQHRIRPAILSILPGLFLIIGWHVYLKAVHAVIPSDFARPTLHLLSVNLGRFGAIVGTAFAEITEISHWSIFWLLVLVAMVYLFVARTFSHFLLAIGVLGPLIFYPLTYLFSAWPSYTAHMTSSLPRLFLQVLPAAWLAIGLALSPPKTQPETVEPKLG